MNSIGVMGGRSQFQHPTKTSGVPPVRKGGPVLGGLVYSVVYYIERTKVDTQK